MMFFLTTYIHPLANPIVLSETLNITLDNPRTEEEISFLDKYVRVSLDSPDEAYKHDFKNRLPLSADEGILSIESGLRVFYESNIDDVTVTEFKKNNSDLDSLNQISRMWVILRFSDDGEIKAMKEIADKDEDRNGGPGFFLLEDDNPIEVNSSRAINYAYLLSILLAPSDEYFGRSFLIHKHYWETKTPKIDSKLNMAVMFFAFNADPRAENDESWWYISLPLVLNRIRAKSDLIEKILVSGQEKKDKILYVSKLLKISNCDIADEKYKLVTYVGILELLLTHSPNSMRFNVEDSISKQFQIKVATLVYIASDRTLPIDGLKKRLNTIYKQRSNIAHGNFKELNKYLNGLSKKEGEEEYFDTLLSDTLYYIRCVLSEYLRDADFVEFLKDS